MKLSGDGHETPRLREQRKKRGRPEERKKGSEAGVSREEMQNLR